MQMEEIKNLIIKWNAYRRSIAEWCVNSLKDKTYSFKEYKKKVKECDKLKKEIIDNLKSNGAKGDTMIDMIHSFNDISLVSAFIK